MSANSELIPIEDNIQDCQAESCESVPGGYHTPVLMKESALSSLYRISRAGKHFIIKTAKDQRTAVLIRREYDLSLDLSHPYIIKVFTFEENTPVGEGIVMEYIDGRDLREFLAENPPRQLRKRVLDQLLTAVSYLHSKGVVHNDLKPENILITYQDNTVKLIDFGLSDTDAQYIYKTLGCTPEYASPELRAQQKTDSRSDIYSLGLLLRDILGSKSKRIARKCTASDPARRYANVDQIRKAVARRSFPLYFAITAAIIAAIAEISSQLHELKTNKDASEQEKLEREQEKIREQEFCDSVYNLIDNRVQEICSETEARLAPIEYKEFTYMAISYAGQQFLKLRHDLQEISQDDNLKQSFMSHYEVAIQRAYERLKEIESSKPSIYDGEYTIEEYAYYTDMIAEGRPYEPYKK